MTRSIAAPGVILAACLILMWQTGGMVPAQSASGMFEPAFFPRAILGALMAVSALQIIHEVRRHRAERTGPAPQGTQADGGAQTPDIIGLVTALALAGGYVVAMQHVGFLPATLAFQSALFALVFRMRGLRGIVLLPALLTGLYFLIFLRLLELPLPQGQGVFRALSRAIYY